MRVGDVNVVTFVEIDYMSVEVRTFGVLSKQL